MLSLLVVIGVGAFVLAGGAWLAVKVLPDGDDSEDDPAAESDGDDAVDLVETGLADPDDAVVQVDRCEVVDDVIEAGGRVQNTSGAPQAFLLQLAVLVDDRLYDGTTTEVPVPLLADGADGEWAVTVGAIDPDAPPAGPARVRDRAHRPRRGAHRLRSTVLVTLLRVPPRVGVTRTSGRGGCETRGVGDPFAPPPPPGEWGFDAPAGPPPTNGVAISASVVGVLAVLPAVTIVFAVLAVFPGIVAIVLGVVGLSISRRHPAAPGRGLAIGGIVCGVLTFVALIIEIVLFAVVLDSSEVDLVDQREAEVDDYELSDRTCVVENGGAAAVASGILTNRSGDDHAFVIEVRFLDRGLDLGGGRSRATRSTRAGRRRPER